MAVLSGISGLPAVLLLLSAVLFMVLLRQVEARRVQRKFDRRRILVVSFGVPWFGLDTAPGGLLRGSGALVLLRTGLWYRSRFSGRELFIRASSITWLGTSGVFKGRRLSAPALVIGFLDETGKEHQAAFRPPAPDRWAAAIRLHLLNRKSSSQPA